MPKIIFQGKSYPCKQDETVLDVLLRANANVAFSCRNGICHACLLQSKNGTPPKRSQSGLPESLAKKSFFLACKCKVENDMEIEVPKTSEIYGRALICGKEMITADVCRLYLETATALYYHPGQFINIRQAGGLTRSYSLASVPYEEQLLEIHIKRLPGGAMSRWLIDEAPLGSELDFQGPLGNCYYRNPDNRRNLLLICTGTGLAPMLGIARDALNQKHIGQLYLYHGSSSPDGLYMADFLRALQKVHTNFHYIPCVSGQISSPAAAAGRANDVAFSRHKDLGDWRVYVAGNPEMVYACTRQATEHGVNPADIYADPFEFGQRTSGAGDHGANDSKDPQAQNDSQLSNNPQLQNNSQLKDPPFPPPDPEMWNALDQGERLTRILTDFYGRVYEDENLKGFFKDTTKNRAIEKQYNFLFQVFTGEKVYFGEKPRNGHHWMVISDDLFDYREALMKTCLEKHGLPTHLISRWMAMEYNYKDVIVKSKPWNKIVDGVEYPVDGFGEVTMEVGTFCDGCAGEIAAGENVSYHLRLGTVYCAGCKNGTHS